MGLRTRVQGRLKRWLGAGEAPLQGPSAAPGPVTQAPVKQAAPPSSAPPSSAPPSTVAARGSASPAVPAPGTSPASTPSAGSKPKVDDKAAMKAKREKIVARAFKGGLRFALDAGGSATMTALHDHSERTYFIAHRGFSELMGRWVEEGLVRFDEESGLVTLTDAGRAAAEAPAEG